MLADGAEKAKDVAKEGIAKAAAVSKDATVVDFLNKKTEAVLKNDLIKASLDGKDVEDVFESAAHPVKLDDSLINF